MIQDDRSNLELVKAYSSLISKVAEIEIKYFESNMEYSKSYDKNQAEVTKTMHAAQADIAKKQIEKSHFVLPPGEQSF